MPSRHDSAQPVWLDCPRIRVQLTYVLVNASDQPPEHALAAGLLSTRCERVRGEALARALPPRGQERTKHSHYIDSKVGPLDNKQQMAGWPNGKASDYESGDCGFEPHVGHYFLPIPDGPIFLGLLPRGAGSRMRRRLPPGPCAGSFGGEGAPPVSVRDGDDLSGSRCLRTTTITGPNALDIIAVKPVVTQLAPDTLPPRMHGSSWCHGPHPPPSEDSVDDA